MRPKIVKGVFISDAAFAVEITTKIIININIAISLIITFDGLIIFPIY